MKHALLLLSIAGLTILAGAGCEEHKPQIKKAADAVKEAGSKTGEAMKEAGTKIGEAGKESADKIRQSIHEATKPPEPSSAPAASPTTPPTPTPATPTMPGGTSVLSLTVKDIDGKDVPLSQYAGKVLLIVNVASKCGNTPQYAALEELYESRKDNGLVVLGFPANDFGKQEPGSEADIKTFCTDTYHVTFPMFSKVVVKGDGKCELYTLLAAARPAGAEKPLGEPEWNFAKYLVNRKGEVVARFKASTSPAKDEITKAIDAELAEVK